MADGPDKRQFIDERWFKDFGGGLTLAGKRCRDCDRIFFPPKLVCPLCFEGTLEDVPLSRRGKLHTFTQSIMGPDGIETPFIMGMIDLPEGIKLFSLITGCDYDELRIDMPMEMVIERIKYDAQGSEIIGYKFRPVKEERS
jgi:uncharacterized protein